MTTARNLIRKMFTNLEEQQKEINRFYITAQNTITDLYRAKSYRDQLTGTLKKIDGLLAIYERLKPIAQTLGVPANKTKEYAQLLNNIAIEISLLNATSQVMDDQLKRIKESGEIEHRLSGKLVGLKRQVNKTVKKVEEILKSA